MLVTSLRSRRKVLRGFNRAALRHGIMQRSEDPPGGGGGGGGGGDKPISDVVRRLTAAHGSAESALAVLAGENRDYRKRHARDKQSIEALEAKLPKPGEVVLTVEQAKDWASYQAHGKPDEVKKKLDRVDTVEAQLAERDKADLVRTAGDAVKYKASILVDRVKADGLHLEMRDTEVDNGKGGKETKPLPWVRRADKADEPLVLLTEYAKKNWNDYLPALTAAGAGGGVGGGGGNNPVIFPVNQPAPEGGNGKPGGILAQAVEKRKASGGNNPLAPKQDKAAAK